MAKDSKIITGPMGFEIILRGVYPPQVEAMGEQAMVAWATGCISVNGTALGWVKQTEVRPLRVSLSGEFLPPGPERVQ